MPINLKIIVALALLKQAQQYIIFTQRKHVWLQQALALTKAK